MPRRNGSYFGLTVNPTPSVASGIWRVREAEEFLRVNKWPATPGVPGSPVGSAGNEQVSLTWSAPSLGSPPTDYQIQYSSNSGTTWTTFADGTSTATSAVVTGLTNDTGYIFRVRAVNALGEGPYGAASGTVTPSAIVASLLLHCDGSNGSTTFTDSSPTPVEVYRNGNAEISTTQSKFGGASGYFDGATSYLIAESGDALQFGVGDFAVEMWVRFNSTGNALLYDTIPIGGDAGRLGGFALVLQDGQFNIFHDGFKGSPSVTASTGQWYHIAFTRSAGLCRLFVDGQVDSSFTLGVDMTDTVALIGRVGDSAAYFLDGYIDELRVVKGQALYTANFTPPTAAF